MEECKYAIHPIDMLNLQKVEPVFRFCLPALLSSEIVDIDQKRVDGVAILFTCPSTQASAMIQVIRTKYHKHQVRCYEKRASGWRKI